MDIFGSKVAQVHVQREHALDQLRPGASMRTALTGAVKRGFDRPEKAAGKKAPKTKHRRLDEGDD